MITAAIENYRDCIEELKPMFAEHHKVLGLYQDKMPLAPRYDLYNQRNNNGELVMPILRKDGRIIGYWPTFIAPGMHYRTTLTATMDILWVHPDHRGDHGGLLLYNCLDQELRRRGVKLWWVGSKNHKEIETFYEMLGFEKKEAYFAKWIGEA